MVRNIKVVDLYATEEAEPPDEEVQEQASEPPTTAPEPEEASVFETTTKTEAPAEDAAPADAAVEEPSPKPTKKSMKILDMDTTSKVVEQVGCQACGKKMSAKNLKYAHLKYCTERNMEERPEEIPTPENPNKTPKTLPVKRAKAKAKADIADIVEITEEMLQSQAREAPYKGQVDITETPEQFWRRTMKDLKEKKKTQYKNLCSNAV